MSMRLEADPAGKLRYGVEVPDHARAALRAAIAAYHGVELRPVPEPSEEGDDASVEPDHLGARVTNAI